MYQYGNGVKKDYAQAIRWYRLAAEQGDANAQYNIGKMYEHGLGIKRDYSEAIRWYRLAIQQGHERAPDALDWLLSARR